jgi:hypothetical protein
MIQVVVCEMMCLGLAAGKIVSIPSGSIRKVDYSTSEFRFRSRWQRRFRGKIETDL